MTAAIADPVLTTHPSRRVTVRPAPRREPPFDDEIPQRHLTLVGPHDRPLPFAPSRRRLIDRRDAFSMQPTGRGQLPDPAWFGRRLLVAILEAMAGRRSPHQLAPHLSHGVFIALLADLDRPARRAWTVGGAACGCRSASAAVRLALAPAGVAAPVAATAAVGIGTRLLLTLRRLARAAGAARRAAVAARDPYLGRLGAQRRCAVHQRLC